VKKIKRSNWCNC